MVWVAIIGCKSRGWRLQLCCALVATTPLDSISRTIAPVFIGFSFPFLDQLGDTANIT
jgi:hypothetical protein